MQVKMQCAPEGAGIGKLLKTLVSRFGNEAADNNSVIEISAQGMMVAPQLNPSAVHHAV
jgi:hypothetical protein